MNEQNLTDSLDEETKRKIREALVITSGKLIGVKYKYGAEWLAHERMPLELDCSELIEGVYFSKRLRMPDGSQNQFDFTVPTPKPTIGDLAFLGKDNGNPKRIYHVGMIYSDIEIIEARAYDPDVSFETGKVILRPIEKWVNYKNFSGFRAHPKLV